MPHNIDTSLLRAFVAAAETGGMTSAARLVGLTQAAVSQQVKRLEDAFGRRLFERDRRGLRLTPSGERLRGPCPAPPGPERRSLGTDDGTGFHRGGASRRAA